MSDSILMRLAGIPVYLAIGLLLWRLAAPLRAGFGRRLGGGALGAALAVLAVLWFAPTPAPVWLQAAGSAWLRTLSLAAVLAVAALGLTFFFPRRRRLWSVAALALPLLLLPAAWRVAQPYDWTAFTRENLFLLGYIGIHRFVFVRLAAGFSLGETGRRRLAALFWGAGLVFPLRFLRGIYFLHYAAGIWTGATMLAFCAMLAEALLSWRAPRQRRLWTALCLGVALCAAAAALVNARRLPHVRDITVPMPALTPELRAFTVVLMSDLHLGGVESAAWLAGTVDRVNGLHPDLIVICGDLLERDIPAVEAAHVARLRARCGVLAVPGNHEFYMDVDRFSRLARAMGITVLRNRAVRLGNGLQIAGLDDPAGWRFHNGGPDLERALQGTRSGQPLILLSHTPRFFDAAAARGVPLQLSGHTHGGQLAPWGWLSRLFYRYFFGLYRRGNSWIYTSCGAGLWGLPMRLGSRNEIVRITLGAG